MRSNIWRGFMLALWFDITRTQTKTHSTHRGQQTDTTIQIYIKTIFYVLIAAICITLNESFADIKTLFYRVLQCLCFLKIVEVAYLLIRFNKTRFFPRNTKNTDRYDVNHPSLCKRYDWKGLVTIPSLFNFADTIFYLPWRIVMTQKVMYPQCQWSCPLKFFFFFFFNFCGKMSNEFPSAC